VLGTTSAGQVVVLRETWARIVWIYDNVYLAGWSLALSGLICFIIFAVPKLPQARARAELLRAQEISAETKYYCEKWGMPEGTYAHIMCALDLQEFRAKIEKRMADDMDF
jgi:hypothetical protein